MNEILEEDEQILAASERHHQIVEDGDRYFGGVFICILLGLIVVCGAGVGFMVFGVTP